MNFSLGSIVQHFKKERDNFVTINVISKCANLLITFRCLGERWQVHTLNTLTNVRILISKCFENLNFSHWTIVGHFRQESDNFVTINGIPNYTNLLLQIPSLGERWHFDVLNTLKKVQILISNAFWNMSFTHASIVQHFKQERDNFVTINVISSCANLLKAIPCLGEIRHFHMLNTLKKV